MRPKGWINSLPEYIAGKTLEEIKEKYGLEEVYKLASNENIFGPHPSVIDFIERNANIIKYYPDADNREIRKTIAGGLGVDPDWIIMGDGTDQIIEMLCDCYIGSSDNIVIADPTFLIYEKAALKCNGLVKKIALKDFQHDIKAMLDAVDGDTKVVFFTNPHNPIGSRIPLSEFEFALKNIPGHVMIALDEAYFEYLSPDERFDTVGYIKSHKNLITLRTFSKIYGLAGLRIGYAVADKEIISTLNKIRLPFNVNLMAQRAAEIAYKNQDYIIQIRDKVELEKQKFYNYLDKVGAGYIKSYANFILIDVDGPDTDFSESLLEKGFIVRPGKNLGVPGYIRVTISLPEVNDKFLDAFGKIYRKNNDGGEEKWRQS